MLFYISISHQIILFQDIKEATEIQYFAFPSSNKVTEVDEHYFNIVKEELILLESAMMTATHNKMNDNHGKMTDNPEKLPIISTHPGLTFSYHRVLMPVAVAEQGQDGEKYVVGLRIRKLKLRW